MKTFGVFLFSTVMLTHAAFGQKQTFDIFSYTLPPGWTQKTTNGDIQLNFQKGNTWGMVSLYAGTQSTGNAVQDFEADWKDLTRTYTVTGKIEQDEPLSIKGAWMTQGIAPGLYQQQPITITMITFSYGEKRSTAVVVHNDRNHQLDNDLDAFMSQLSVNTPQTETTPQPQSQLTTSSHAQPTMGVASSSEALPTPYAQSITRTTTTEGWTVEATPEYIQYSNPEIKVIQYFFVPPEDPNSNTPDEDLFWRKFLQQYFAADSYTKYPNDPYDFLNRVESASGYVQSRTDTKQYYLVWIVSTNLHCSFLAISNTEAQYQKYFSHPNKLIELERLNYFPVNENDIQGTWVDTEFAGAQLYNINTGAYAGMTVATTATEWMFKGSAVQYHAQGASGTVGNLQTFVVDRSGTFALNGYDLAVTMTKPEKRVSDYYCGFVAGKGGLLLKLQDKNYTAQINFLKRKQ